MGLYHGKGFEKGEERKMLPKFTVQRKAASGGMKKFVTTRMMAK